MNKVFCMLVVFSIVSAILSLPNRQKAKQEKIPSQCADPTFACQDLKNARLCGVIKSCVHDVWETMSVPDDNDEICAICKEMVKEARDQLHSNMTEEEMKEVFEGSCKLIPVKHIADWCIKLADECIPELVEMLSSRMDPTMVCTLAGLCNLVHLPIEVTPNHIREDLLCEFCTDGLEHVKEIIIANTTKEEFRIALLNFCKHVGKLANKCTDLVNDYFDMLYNFVKNLDTKTVCTAIGLCKNHVSRNIAPLVKIFPPVTSSKHIPLVKLLPSHHVKIEGSMHPLLKIIPAIRNSKKNHGAFPKLDSNVIFENRISQQLPLERLSQSVIFFNSSLDCPFCKAITFFLKKGLNEDRTQENVKRALNNICENWFEEYPDHCASFLRKYSGKIQNDIIENGDFTSICFSIKACSMKEDGYIDRKKFVSPEVKGIGCDACKEIVLDLQNKIKDPETQKQMINEMKQLCSHIPSFATECEAMVDKYAAFVINMFVNAMDPSEICTLLNLCADRKKFVSPEVKGIGCDACKEMVLDLQNKIKDPETQKQMINEMKVLCSHIPSFATECEAMVDKYAAIVINMFVNAMDPSEICTLLNLCADRKKFVSPEIKGIGCDACKEIVLDFQNKIKDPETQKQMINEMKQLCSHIPSFATECEAMVDKYAAFVINMFVNAMDPSEICTLLNLCADRKKFVSPEVKGIGCDACKEIVLDLQNKIKDPETQKQMINEMKQLCSHIPSFATECEAMVDKYAAFVINMFVNAMDPSEICTLLNLCADRKKFVSPEVKGIGCDACKEIVLDLQNKIKDPETQKQMINEMKQLCSHIPSFATECEAMVDKYAAFVINMFVNAMDPSEICTLLNLCADRKKFVSPEVKGIGCDACKEIVLDFQNKIKDPETQKQMINEMKQLCSHIPSFATECEAMVDKYAAFVINMFVNAMDPSEICTLLNLCADRKKFVSPEVKGIGCDACKEMVLDLQNKIKDPETQKQMINEMKQLCSHVPSFATECEAMVDKYAAFVINMFVNAMDPSEICTLLNLCADRKKFVSPEVKGIGCDACKEMILDLQNKIKDPETQKQMINEMKELCSHIPSFATECEAMVDKYAAFVINMFVNVMDPSEICTLLNLCADRKKFVSPEVKGIGCDACKEMVLDLQNKIKDPETQKQMINEMKQLCSHIPSFATECEAMVDKYAAFVINMFVNAMDPSEICTLLNLCADRKKFVSPEVKGIGCDACKEMVLDLQNKIKDPETQKQMINEMKQLCSHVPSFATECEAMVDKYAAFVINMFVNAMDPSEICTLLNLCAAENLKCETCQYFLHFAQNLLYDSGTQTEIKALLMKCCNVLPKSFSENCAAFVDEYGDSLLVLIAQELDPSLICPELRFCPTFHKNLTKFIEFKGKYVHFDECKLCIKIVDYIDQLLLDESIDKDITALASKVCSFLPASVKVQCSNIVETYGPYILLMIEQSIDSKGLCQEMDLCDRAIGQVHLLGGKKCTYGPTYWCRSKAHASACKAETYCNLKN